MSRVWRVAVVLIVMAIATASAGGSPQELLSSLNIAVAGKDFRAYLSLLSIRNPLRIEYDSLSDEGKRQLEAEWLSETTDLECWKVRGSYRMMKTRTVDSLRVELLLACPDSSDVAEAVTLLWIKEEGEWRLYGETSFADYVATEVKHNMLVTRDAADKYASKNEGKYPESWSAFVDLVTRPITNPVDSALAPVVDGAFGGPGQVAYEHDLRIGYRIRGYDADGMRIPVIHESKASRGLGFSR